MRNSEYLLHLCYRYRICTIYYIRSLRLLFCTVHNIKFSMYVMSVLYILHLHYMYTITSVVCITSFLYIIFCTMDVITSASYKLLHLLWCMYMHNITSSLHMQGGARVGSPMTMKRAVPQLASERQADAQNAGALTRLYLLRWATATLHWVHTAMVIITAAWQL